jgi:hypothetical protein
LLKETSCDVLLVLEETCRNELTLLQFAIDLGFADQ